MKNLKPYSVLLMYPDYVADVYGETYYDFVAATSPKDAVKIARERCAEAHNLDLEDWEDLAVVLITEGHNKGV